MIGGITVNIAGKEFVVPPANLRAVKGWMHAQKTVQPGTIEYVEEMTKFVLAVLNRNYPELTLEQLDEILDQHALATLMRTVAEAGGLKSGEEQTGT